MLEPELTEKVSGMQYYFPGSRHLFIDNDAPALGVVNNGECIARGILLAEGEEDSMQGPIWWLKQPPVAIFVEPVESTVSDDAWHTMKQQFPTLPPRCVPIVTRHTPTFEVKLPEKLQHQGKQVSCMRLTRWGVPLADAYAVTDFYCQGMNFRQQCWLAHLCPPTDGGGLKRASVFVVISRWGRWEDVRLIVPLWPEGDMAERARVIQAFMHAACLEPELAAEMRRLKALAAQAKGVYQQQWATAVQATAPSND